MNNITTLVGNLTADPEIRFLDSGAPLTTFVLAVNERVFDKQTGQWQDGDSLFIRVTAWRNAGAENIIESLTKGSRAMVTGKLRQNTYKTDNGEKRTVIEMTAEEVGASLRFATAKVAKADRASTQSAPQASAWEAAPAAVGVPF